MRELGILEERGTELIHGEIIEISPVSSAHAGIVEKLKDLLTISLFEKAMVRVQNPIRLSDLSEPEPDLAIVNYRKDYYTTAHPKANDIIILIEVAISSLDYDQEIKMPLYASQNIPEYWLEHVRKFNFV